MDISETLSASLICLRILNELRKIKSSLSCLTALQDSPSAVGFYKCALEMRGLVRTHKGHNDGVYCLKEGGREKNGYILKKDEYI